MSKKVYIQELVQTAYFYQYLKILRMPIDIF